MSKRMQLGSLPPRGAVSKRQKKILSLLEIGMKLQQRKKFDEALQYYNKILRIDSNNSDALYMRAQVHINNGEHKKAIDNIERCLKTNPDNTTLLYILGLNYSNMGRRFESIRHLSHAIKIDPGYQMARLLLVKGYIDTGRTEQGRHCLAQGGSLDFKEPDERITYYNILVQLGFYGEAKDIILGLIEEGVKLTSSLYELTRLPGANWNESHLRLIDELLSDEKITGEDGKKLHFAAGRIADREARYPEAMAHFEGANKNLDASFDMARFQNTAERLARMFPGDYFPQRKNQGYQGTRPVFIVGLPRSGKSLIERALSQRPEIGRVGEITMSKLIEGDYFLSLDGELPDKYEIAVPKLGSMSLRDIAAQYLRELDRYVSESKFILNSLPHNFQNIGFLKTVFPNAKIIHVTRDPADTCLFCFMKDFKNAHDYASDLGVLGAYYRIYHDLMAHWDRALPGQIYQISYENFVTDPTAALKGLIAYLDLEWDDDALNAPLETAFGTFEPGRAPEPVNTSYIGYWKNYEPHLAPLFEALGDLAPSVRPS